MPVPPPALLLPTPSPALAWQRESKPLRPRRALLLLLLLKLLQLQQLFQLFRVASRRFPRCLMSSQSAR